MRELKGRFFMSAFGMKLTANSDYVSVILTRRRKLLDCISTLDTLKHIIAFWNAMSSSSA